MILRRVRGVDEEGYFNVREADTGTPANTYTDDVAAETPYTYRIKAVNAAGESPRSRWVHIDTPATPPSDDAEQQEPTDDFPASTPTTGSVTVGHSDDSVVGAIETSDDVDWILLQSPPGYWFTLTVSGYGEDGRSALDTPYLKEYYELNGDLMVPEHSLNKNAPACSSNCTHTKPSVGSARYVAVTGRNGNTGSYRLTVILVSTHESAYAHTDFAADTDTDGFLDMLRPGERPGYNVKWNRVQGFAPPGDVDWYRTELDENQGYRFTLHEWDSDLKMQVKDADGEVIQSVGSGGIIRMVACQSGDHFIEVRHTGEDNHTGTYTVQTHFTDGLEANPIKATLLNDGQAQLDWQCWRTADSHRIQFKLGGTWTTVNEGTNASGINMSLLNDGFTAKFDSLPTGDAYPEYRFRIAPVNDGTASDKYKYASLTVIPDTPGNPRGGWYYNTSPEAVNFQWETVSGQNVRYEVQVWNFDEREWTTIESNANQGIFHSHQPGSGSMKFFGVSPRYAAIDNWGNDYMHARVRATIFSAASPWTQHASLGFPSTEINNPRGLNGTPHRRRPSHADLEHSDHLHPRGHTHVGADLRDPQRGRPVGTPDARTFRQRRHHAP